MKGTIVYKATVIPNVIMVISVACGFIIPSVPRAVTYANLHVK